MRVNDFDSVASIYDALSALIFGKELIRASTTFLHEITEGSKVLILGGGTGKILSSMGKGSHIIYVEKSQKMIERAKKANSWNKDIKFIQDDFLTMAFHEEYDYVICPFFLDAFNLEHLDHILNKIRGLLTSNGNLLVADFQPVNHWFGKFIMGAMFRFFKITSNLEAHALIPIHQLILRKGFEPISFKEFYLKMIFSRKYIIA